jgi:hypothetical protein
VNKILLSFSVCCLLFSALIHNTVNGQGRAVKMVSVAFYNFENLFDTINDPEINDEEFLPEGRNEWNSEKYYTKLKNLAQVISQIGDEYIKGGPSILGFSEVENRTVVEDLINTEPLKSIGYDIVHFQSADRRGIDVGLIYRKSMFKVVHAAKHRLFLPSNPDFVTRDVVVVAGMFENEKFHILVNHWPSRSGGELETAKYRAAMATLCRECGGFNFCNR